MNERTLVLVKPDGVQRGLVGEVISRIERKGLKLVALQLKNVDRKLAEQHYADTTAAVLQRPARVHLRPGGGRGGRGPAGGFGVPADRRWHRPGEGWAGSIRGDYGLEVQYNLVHGSDSPESRSGRSSWVPGAGEPDCRDQR